MKWCAIYTDNSRLMQYEGDKENPYTAVQRGKLKSFDILSDDDKLILSVVLERPTQRLIYRRRVFTDLFGNPKDVVWLVGWHETIHDTNIKSICYIYSDGHIEIIGCEK
jgi:hypothetical protein